MLYTNTHLLTWTVLSQGGQQQTKGAQQLQDTEVSSIHVQGRADELDVATLCPLAFFSVLEGQFRAMEAASKSRAIGFC